MRNTVPYAAALHPVMAVLLFLLSWWLAQAAARAVRAPAADMHAAAEKDA